MPTQTRLRLRRRWALSSAAVAIVAGAALALSNVGHAAASEEPSSVVAIEADGFRYEYHVPTATEAVYDLRADPERRRNVAAADADRARDLRRALESRLSVRSLEDLRAKYADTIRRLHSLGYM